MNRTRRKRLLQLLGLLGILEDQSVEVLLASDLELDGRGLLVLLDPGGYTFGNSLEYKALQVSRLVNHPHVQEASFRLQISMN